MTSALVFLFLMKGTSQVVDTTARSPLPALVLLGDQAAVGAVREALSARHVPLAPAGTEGAVSAQIDQDDTGLALTIRDPAGRMARHQVATAALAASLIESWMRPDLTGPLLAARPMPEPEAPVVIASPAPRTPEVALAAETSLGSESSLWTGASAAAMFGRGRVRLGPLARFGTDTRAGAASGAVYGDGGDAKDADLSRWQIDLMAAAELPLPLGRLRLRPGLAVGAFWLHTRASHEERAIGASAVRPLAEARVTVTLPLGHHLGLDLGLGAAVAPIAAGAGQQGDFWLPAGPRARLRASLGVRYGGP